MIKTFFLFELAIFFLIEIWGDMPLKYFLY